MTCLAHRRPARSFSPPAAVRLLSLAALAALATLAGACGGAAEDSLTEPPRGAASDASTGTPGPDASTPPVDTSPDATVDDTGAGDDLEAAAPEASDPDAESLDAGVDGSDAALCVIGCGFGQRCCAVRGAISYGQCYSPTLCAGCCF
jgi:hypothetical protein